jgi:RNA polymerase sigma-70 factor (ECF subfamily)
VVGRAETEAELVERARARDVTAYAALVRAHQEIAFRTAVLICGDAAEAEEAAQDGFLKAYRSLGRFRAGEPLRPWLLAIVANEARDRRRAAGRRGRLAVRLAEELEPSRRAPASPTDPEPALLARERGATLLSALDRLGERDRTVIGCRCLLELSEAETARVLGVRPGTVKSRLSRALARLREEVGTDVR